MVISKDRTERAKNLGQSFGARINGLRRERNWSQRELSEHAYRIDRAYISRIESGVVEPCLSTIGELARAFGVSLRDLFDGVE